MVAGADSIDDLALLRHGGMKKVFDGCYAPSTLGQFLRAFRFGHVRQLDAVASRFLSGLAERTGLTAGVGDYALVDVDDTIVEVHGYAKQGSGYGYSGVRGLNVLLATVSTEKSAPVIVAQRLRKGACGSPRGAKRLVADALATTRRLRETTPPGSDSARTLLRADSAFYGSAVVGAVRKSRRRRVGHGAAGSQGEGRDRWNRRRRMDTDRVSQRGLRRGRRRLDLSGRGRRDPVHRLQQPEEDRAGARPARRAPHPRFERRRRPAYISGRLLLGWDAGCRNASGAGHDGQQAG